MQIRVYISLLMTAIPLDLQGGFMQASTESWLLCN